MPVVRMKKGEVENDEMIEKTSVIFERSDMYACNVESPNESTWNYRRGTRQTRDFVHVHRTCIKRVHQNRKHKY